MQSCNGVCLKYSTRGTSGPNADLMPKCSVCDILIDVDGIKCPCCKSLLSWKRVRLGLGEGKLVKA